MVEIAGLRIASLFLFKPREAVVVPNTILLG
jgi:hypothetical protein